MVMVRDNGAVESLGDFVRRVRMSAHLSLKDVEHRSGGDISSGYISQIENGFVTNPSTQKLRALSRGLRVSEDELFARARGLSEPESFKASRFWELFVAYEQIAKPTHRRMVDQHLADLVSIVEALPKKERAAG